MPREDSEPRSPLKNSMARLKDTVMTPFLKGKNEQKSLQGKKDIKKDQKVVAFLDDNRTVRGHVRYIGEHKDRSGNLLTLVGLELVGSLYNYTKSCIFSVNSYIIMYYFYNL